MPTLPGSLALAATIALTVAASAGGQEHRPLPFAPGERLTFEGKVRAGISGSGSLWIEGPVDVRGTATWLLHSDMEGRVGPLRASDHTASWLDPVRMASLRYTSRERHIISRHDDAVEIHPAERHWRRQSGESGAIEASAPLDELSFLYYLRTLPLTGDTTFVVARHYDASRNPTGLRVTGREELEVPAGRFTAVVVEMRVRDARRYQGEGLIRIHLSDDSCRLILRLESRVPGSGAAILALSSYEGTRGPCTARLRD